MDGPNGIDRASKIHDILYSLSKSEQDIRAADQRLIRDIEKSSQGPKTKKLAIAMLKGKIFGENIGAFDVETFTDLPGLRGEGPTRKSDTGIVGLDNSLVGNISGPVQTGTGRDQNMFFRGVLGDFVTPQKFSLHGNFKNSYDNNLHNFIKQTGMGQHGEGIKEVKEFIKSGIDTALQVLPGDRLKSELLKGAKKVQRAIKMRGKGGRSSINDDELCLCIDKDTLLEGMEFHKKEKKPVSIKLFDKSQKGGQLGLLASLAASFIIPLIIKKIRGKGQFGGRLSKVEINKLLGSILGIKKGAKGLSPLISIGIEKLKKSGKLKQKGGQFGLLASLAASILLPEIIKKIRGKGSI